ncbi:MFS transporter [Streptomyces cinnabarinus]|uniref:MFS transporter n=1 Tax=Streptomyces cinnabarinus TaxID=67287 RepID=A0ABY7KMJ3_9ACTN|nr:MFS transporter [Streptomyces cinnabarinus]WAZ25784.1 MFS transporter [Streptomyces cinnabarinus]
MNEREVRAVLLRDRQVFSPTAVVASCAGFVLLGVLQALYGPAVPAFREEFGLSPSGAGLGLSAHFVGGVAGVLLFDRAFGRIGNRRILGASFLLMAVGAAGFALAPVWPLALVMALLAGLGFGGVDYGLNQLFAVGFGRRSTTMLNILNAHFGIGAILGPVLIGLVGADRYRAVFLAFALAGLPLLLCLRGVSDQAPAPTGTEAEPGGSRVLARSLGSVLAVFIALYVLHVGIEAGVGGWEPTHLEAVGYGAGLAATATSLYWLMLTVGRFLVAPLALRFSPQAIITVSCAGMTVCLLLASVPAFAPYAYAGVGLFIAPIFPTGLPWLHRAAPRARRAGAVVIAASMAGGVVAGPALGKAIEWSGVRTVPLLLGAISALCLAATLWLVHATRSPSPGAATEPSPTPGPHPHPDLGPEYHS